MLGSFKNAFIWVTPRLQDGTAWTLDAEHVSYALEEDGAITLRVTRRQNPVKDECDEQGACPNECVAKEMDTSPGGDPKEEEFMLSQPSVPSSILGATVASSSHAAPGQPSISAASSLLRQPESVTVKMFTVGTTDSGDHGRTLKRQKQREGTRKRPYKKRKASSRSTSQKPAHVPCTVPGCIRASIGAVKLADSMGPSGRRCKRHGGGRRCNVEGCNQGSVRRTLYSDSHGQPGSRCANHSVASRCSVADCDRAALKGKVCGKHGGVPRCNVTGCEKMRVGFVDNADDLGEAGNRCWRHGGRFHKKKDRRAEC